MGTRDRLIRGVPVTKNIQGGGRPVRIWGLQNPILNALVLIDIRLIKESENNLG